MTYLVTFRVSDTEGVDIEIVDVDSPEQATAEAFAHLVREVLPANHNAPVYHIRTVRYAQA